MEDPNLEEWHIDQSSVNAWAVHVFCLDWEERENEKNILDPVPISFTYLWPFQLHVPYWSEQLRNPVLEFRQI